MKEQTQLTGVRKYFGDDLLAIQNEIMEAQEAYFSPYGNCIVKGCEVDEQDISEGICYIGGKIVRFVGTAGVVSFPVYLELNEAISKTREYQTGGVKEIEREFKAVLTTSVPTGDYITINSNGGKTFRESFQDANNRMVTDTQINTWNAKEPAIIKKTGFNKDKSDSISSTNTDVLATSAAARTAYNRGSTGITDAANAYNRGTEGVNNAANALSVANSKLAANAQAVDAAKLGGKLPEDFLNIAFPKDLGIGQYVKAYYSITSSTPRVLKKIDNSSFLATDKREMLVFAYLSGTGTITGTFARFVGDGSSWTVTKIFATGASSNHVNLFVENGLPKIGTWHAASYSAIALQLESGFSSRMFEVFERLAFASQLNQSNVFTQAQTAPDFIIS